MNNHQVEIALPAAVMEFTGPVHQITRLPQGTGNPHWRIDSALGVWVWRQFQHGIPTMPLRAREERVLHHLAGFSFAPQRVWHAVEYGVLFRFAEGITPRANQVSPRARQKLLAHMMTWWAVDIELEAYDYAALIRQYANDAHNQGKAARHIATLVDSVVSAQHWPTTAFRLTHHDLHAGNLLLHGDTWLVLDWEYAGLANPWVDAVMLDRILHLTEQERRLLASALPNLGEPDPWHYMHQWVDNLETLWWLGRP